jgi:hypothetical protein
VFGDDGEPGGFVTVVASVPPHVLEPLPSTPTPIPQTFTGAVIGVSTPSTPVPGVPGSAEPVPLVLLAVPAAVAGQADDPSPRTPAEMPHTVTGALTGATALTPPPNSPPSRPVSEPPPVPLVLLAVPAAELAAVGQPDDPLPRTPAEMPHTVTGALTGALAVRPPDGVVAPPDVADEPDEVVPDGGVLLPAGCPTCSEMPLTLIGALIGALADVSPEPAVEVELSGVVAGQPDEDPPRIPMLIPQTVTGALTGACTESAEAMPWPTTHKPPARMLACRQRLITWFMTSPNGSCGRPSDRGSEDLVASPGRAMLSERRFWLVR